MRPNVRMMPSSGRGRRRKKLPSNTKRYVHDFRQLLFVIGTTICFHFAVSFSSACELWNGRKVRPPDWGEAMPRTCFPPPPLLGTVAVPRTGRRTSSTISSRHSGQETFLVRTWTSSGGIERHEDPHPVLREWTVSSGSGIKMSSTSPGKSELLHAKKIHCQGHRNSW